MTSPSFEVSSDVASYQAPAMKSDARLQVKNTFFTLPDDAEQEASQVCRRAFRTCPDPETMFSHVESDDDETEAPVSDVTPKTPQYPNLLCSPHESQVPGSSHFIVKNTFIQLDGECASPSERRCRRTKTCPVEAISPIHDEAGSVSRSPSMESAAEDAPRYVDHIGASKKVVRESKHLDKRVFFASNSSPTASEEEPASPQPDGKANRVATSTGQRGRRGFNTEELSEELLLSLEGLSMHPQQSLPHTSGAVGPSPPILTTSPVFSTDTEPEEPQLQWRSRGDRRNRGTEDLREEFAAAIVREAQRFARADVKEPQPQRRGRREHRNFGTEDLREEFAAMAVGEADAESPRRMFPPPGVLCDQALLFDSADGAAPGTAAGSPFLQSPMQQLPQSPVAPAPYAGLYQTAAAAVGSSTMPWSPQAGGSPFQTPVPSPLYWSRVPPSLPQLPQLDGSVFGGLSPQLQSPSGYPGEAAQLQAQHLQAQLFQAQLMQGAQVPGQTHFQAQMRAPPPPPVQPPVFVQDAAPLADCARQSVAAALADVVAARRCQASKHDEDSRTLVEYATKSVAAAKHEIAQLSHVANQEALSNAERPVRPHNKRPLRLWAHIYLHMQLPGFDLVPMLIGRGGQNMRKIANATGAKVRVRGRGSGHLEVDGKREAPTPLMVAVTTEKKDAVGFRKAVEMTLVELRTVERRFHVFCEKNNTTFEGPSFSIGLLTEGAEELLGPLPGAKASTGVLDGVQFGVPGAHGQGRRCPGRQ